MRLASAVVIAAALSTAAGAATFPFTTIDVPGASMTFPYGINNQGQIVGLFVDATGQHDFLKQGDVFTPFDVPGATPAGPATGINNAGQIVGNAYGGSIGWFGFLKEAATVTTLQDPDSTASATFAIGINDAGVIVGYYWTDTLPGPFHGFLKTGPAYQTIDIPGAAGTSLYGINNAGQIVGTFTDSAGQHGFLKDGAQISIINIPGSVEVAATAINNHGQIIGVFADTHGQHGFLKEGSSITILDVSGASQTIPLGINDAGQIVGWFGGVPGDIDPHGFVTRSLPDTIPPVITLSVSPGVLWPPNHKLVEIAVNVTATDNRDPNPTIELVSVTSNQPSNAGGDGNTNPDIVVDNGRIFLRAERSGNNSDRIYTITYAATDASGNRATAAATVLVPHS